MPINRETKRIICISINANSPHFCVSSESRKVAKDLYPIRLPVFQKVVLRKDTNNSTDSFYADRVVDENKEDTPEMCRGHTCISAEHDVFLFDLNKLASFYISTYYWNVGPFGGLTNFGWRSASLTQLQCQGVRRIMLIEDVNEGLLKEGCRKTLRCAVRCGALKYSTWHDEEVFSGVEECIYVALAPGVGLELIDIDLYRYILRRPGHRVIARLDRGNCIVIFDKE